MEIRWIGGRRESAEVRRARVDDSPCTIQGCMYHLLSPFTCVRAYEHDCGNGEITERLWETIPNLTGPDDDTCFAPFPPSCPQRGILV
jgi:hypothetical protein